MELLQIILAGLIFILFGWVMLLPLRDVKANQLFIIQKLNNMPTKEEFLAQIGTLKTGLADLSTEIDTVSTKVDALETAIKNSSTIPQDVADAFTDLQNSFGTAKTKMDALNTKADNTPTV